MTLDPIYAKDLPHIWACNQIFNGLVAFDDEMNVVPAIAKSWNISDDGMTYTFVLRDDVWFHEDNCFAVKTPRHQDTKTPRANSQKAMLYAERLEKNDNYSVVRFSWEPAELSFAEILEAAGEIPLPPYLHREAEASDRERYQTVFAKYEGSVAAPTAGLHFTNELIDKLKNDGVAFEEVTLHVGAGTFRPVSSEKIGEHEMHSETIAVRKSCIENLIKNISLSNKI